MRSEDIARYVAGLEAEVERLRAALPVLPEVDGVWRDGDGTVVIESVNRGYSSRDEALLDIACGSAALTVFDTEAADTIPDTSRVTFGSRHEGTGMVLLQHADLPSNRWGQVSREGYAWHRDAASGGFSEYRAAHAALAEVREALNTAEAHGVDVDERGANVAGVGPSAYGTLGLRVRAYLAREVQALVDQGLRGDDLNARLPYEVRDHRTVSDLKVDSKSSVEAEAVEEFCNRPHYGTHGEHLWQWGGRPHRCPGNRAPVEAADTSSDDDVEGESPTDRALTEALRQRDEAIDAADALAEALAGDTWIGEHTSENDPWQNALDAHRIAPSNADVREAHRRGFDAAMRSSRGEAALSDAEHRAARTSEEAGQ